MMKLIGDTGDELGGAVDAYSRAIRSMVTKLMAALRNLKETSIASEDSPMFEPLEQNPQLLLDVGGIGTRHPPGAFQKSTWGHAPILEFVSLA